MRVLMGICNEVSHTLAPKDHSQMAIRAVVTLVYGVSGLDLE